MNGKFRWTALVAALLWLVLLPTAGRAQLSNRLILKDGSYQSASKWEVRGDRVRYFSSERNEWEEIPTSLVDWKATEDFGKQRESQRSLDLKEAEEEDLPERASVLAAMPTVAPGIQLPNSGGVFVLDNYNAQPELVQLTQNGGELNRQSGRNILRQAINPLAGAKQSVELAGEHAQVQVHTAHPTLFVDIDQASEANSIPLDERFRIAKLDPKKGSRVIGNLKVELTGKVSQQKSLVALAAEKLGNWVKLTPQRPLPPGEYALVEMLSPKEMNLFVWDFGVNPTAPQNPATWKPAPRPSPGATEQRPNLENRPH